MMTDVNPATKSAAPSIVLDVFEAAPADLRRRLQEQVMSARLPGGLLLEDSPTGATYQLTTQGKWAVAQVSGEWHFSHPEGHVVVLGDEGLTVRPA